MRKVKYIVLLLTGAFIISNVVAELALLTAAENHKKHECPHSGKAATSQEATEQGHKNHDCPGMKGKEHKKMCPEHLKGVTKTSTNIDNGVEITMTAKKAKTVSKLREIAKMHYDSKESMCQDCPCKVEGAIVKIEDIENGVKVSITSDNPESVKKIQELSAKGYKHKSYKEGLSSREVLSDEIGKETVCPVTKEKFKVVAETKAIDYKGKTYYFCCPGCDAKFIKKPEQYISKETKKSVKYVCPMGCAESDKPGKCPKCKMEMIEKNTKPLSD
ncbi:MAG: YHS domain-containing protein [Elusimicrobia bacterium]|nr:YHS domain-containing protein [Elusimicrobiota bacterium]